MAIPLELLRLTESRAPGFLIYGKPGTKKTNAIYTLPPPILMLDFEGGTAAVTPWIRRARKSDESAWKDYTQKEREAVIDLLQEKARNSIIRKPAPLIDVVSFDVMRYEAHLEFTALLGALQPRYYNSVVIDPVKEFSVETQTFSKGPGGSLEPMELKLWGGAQERAAIAFRVLRNLRDKGVFIYLTGGELIDKDFVTDPRSLPKGASPEQPFSVTATVDLPGKLVGVIEHLCDVQLRARPLNGEPTWVAVAESLPSGNCSWVTKDRFGRLPAFNPPSIYSLCASIYGREGRDAIYDFCSRSMEERNASAS